MVKFDGRQGILKCHYKEKEHVVQLLLSIKNIGMNVIVIATDSTSGTIRGLTDKKQKSKL